MQVRKQILLLLGAFVGFLLLSFAALYLVRLLPMANASTHIISAERQLLGEDGYPDAFGLNTRSENWQRDNVTDSIMLSESLPDPSLSIFQSVLQSRYRVAQHGKAVDSAALPTGVTMGSSRSTELVSYERYWHGYQVLLRPLFELFSYNAIRILNGLLLFALTLLTMFLIIRKGYPKTVAVLFAMALFVTSCFIVPFSLQFVGVFYIALAGMIVLLLLENKKPGGIKIKMTFLLLGMFTSFIDFLTVPVITLVLPLLMLAVTNRKNFIGVSSRKKFYKALILNILIWIVGYAFFWIAKWILVALFSSNTGAISDGFTRILGKMFVGNASTTVLHHLEAIVWNIVVLVPGTAGQSVAVRLIAIVVFLLAVGVVWYFCFKKAQGTKSSLVQNLPFLVIALIPTLWLIVFAEQTFGVYFFANRAHLGTIYALLLFGYYTVDWNRLHKGFHQKRCLSKADQDSTVASGATRID
ncbi:MAG: hypothetical protein FWF45_01495 [Coriobacteriia bacterium]|nr:hypothetical protein [Coriobacteriia bacterium]